MRPTLLAAVPLFAGLIALPAEAQVSARIHVDIPIGRQSPVVYSAPRRPLIVREYDQRQFGDWDRYYDEWIPETVYYYDGYYYDYPIVAYAQPIYVYRFRNERFFAPRQRDFIVWQQRFRFNDYRRDIGRNYRPNQHDNRNDRNDRNDRNYQPPRDDRNGRDGRDGRDVRPTQPRQDDRNGRGGRDVRPTQQQDDRNGRGGRDVRPAQPQRDERSVRQGPAARDQGRSRPRPN